MHTRSQTLVDQHPIYDVTIDFDGASEAWRKNKKQMKNGTFIYTCEKCKRIPKFGYPLCYHHLKESKKN
jgi:hypothetical protein